MVHDVGGRILTEDGEATALHASVDRIAVERRPARCVRVAVLPVTTGELLSSLSATCDAIALRPLLGTGEVRFAPDALGDGAQRRARRRRSHGGQTRRRALGRGWRTTTVALELMRSVKLQLDPARTLSPGRQVGGI